MNVRVLEHDNEPARKTNEKLYLDSRTADVHFGFGIGTDHPKRVPAHKNILSVLSPVFDTMFYGSLPEKGDVPIADASAEVFKEFLQFFYLDRVRLTYKNIVNVMNLCKKYEVGEGLKMCGTLFQNALTNNNVCWGYAIALLLGQESLVKFCEKKIKENSSEVVKSESFLEIDDKTMAKILEFVSSKCCALEIVNGCMEWAKTKCTQNDLETNSTNLRTQFGELFNKIPFCKLTIEQFTHFITTYKGFFTASELENNIQQIVTNKTVDTQATAVKIQPIPNLLLMKKESRVLVCDRYIRYRVKIPWSEHFFKEFVSVFTTNKTLSLADFTIKLKRSSECQQIKGKCVGSVFKNDQDIKSYFIDQVVEIPKDVVEFRIALPEPARIEHGVQHKIILTMACCGNCYVYHHHENMIKSGDGIEIKFDQYGERDSISRLTFKTPE